MGCDIHIIVQRREGADWLRVGADEAGIDWRRRPNPEARCYALFARLADVRNSYVAPVPALFAGRGLPPDLASEHGRNYPFNGDLGEHSFTHATVAELRAADWQVPEGGRYSFVEWLFGPEIEALVNAHGADGVRVLIGFDS